MNSVVFVVLLSFVAFTAAAGVDTNLSSMKALTAMKLPRDALSDLILVQT